VGYLQQFLIILLLVVLGSIKVTIQSGVSRHYIRCSQDSVLFNIMFFLSVALAIAVIFGVGPITLDLTLWAMATSAGAVLFQMFYAMGLREGPVSITVLIINFNIFIVTAVSAIVYHESIYITQLVGIVLLIASMLLSVKEPEAGKTMSRKWLFMTLFATLMAGVSGAVQKIFSVSHNTATDDVAASTFLFLLYLTGAAMLAVIYFVTAFTGKKERAKCGIRLGMIGMSLGMGLTLGIYQKFYTYGCAVIDGTFMFPTYAGMSSLFMTVIGIIVFRDKLSRRQILGMLCGILCIVLMNLRLGQVL